MQRTTRITAFRRNKRERRGTILVLSVFLMVVMLAVIALSVDVGYMQNAQTELDRAVDAGALAGAGTLPQGLPEAEEAAFEYMQLNPVSSRPFTIKEVGIEAGHWNEENRQFTSDTVLPTALRVTAERSGPLFFSRVFGNSSFDMSSAAVATFPPRDIVVVLDNSDSMNDDSEFLRIPVLGREAIEDNLRQIYTELGSPDFGSLTPDPQYMTVVGQQPTNSDRPQLTVEYRYNHVYVTSTKPFDRIRIHRSTSGYKQFIGSGTWNSDKGVYERTLTYNGSRQVKMVVVRSGYNDAAHTEENRYSETFDFRTSTKIRQHARNAFNLNGVSYPYPAGSWDAFIDYCRSTRNQNGDAGYFYRFGYLNLVNFWLDRYPHAHETPGLWATSEQPLKAVKNSVDAFLRVMQDTHTSDRVGLVIYNSSSGWGKLEHDLTLEYDVIGNIANHRQAAHYDSATNIAAGIDTACQELDENGREDAVKMIVLMTDGVPTVPINESYARSLAIQSAQKCASKDYRIVTISLGTAADVSLMDYIANTTGGVHFNVAGTSQVVEYEKQMTDTFRGIAQERHLRLVGGKHQPNVSH